MREQTKTVAVAGLIYHPRLWLLPACSATIVIWKLVDYLADPRDPNYATSSRPVSEKPLYLWLATLILLVIRLLLKAMFARHWISRAELFVLAFVDWLFTTFATLSVDAIMRHVSDSELDALIIAIYLFVAVILSTIICLGVILPLYDTSNRSSDEAIPLSATTSR